MTAYLELLRQAPRDGEPDALVPAAHDRDSGRHCAGKETQTIAVTTFMLLKQSENIIRCYY